MTNSSNPSFYPKFEIGDTVCVNIDKDGYSFYTDTGIIAAGKVADNGIYYDILVDDPHFFCTVHEDEIDFL